MVIERGWNLEAQCYAEYPLPLADFSLNHLTRCNTHYSCLFLLRSSIPDSSETGGTGEKSAIAGTGLTRHAGLVPRACCARLHQFATNRDEYCGLGVCGKTIIARWKFKGPHISDIRRIARRMLKMAVQQGCSERRGEGVRFGTLSF